MGFTAPTRLVSDVKRSVARQFGDESGVQLEDTDIFMWINDAVDEIIKRNHPQKARSSISSIIGQADYSLATLKIAQLEAIHYAGRRLPNMPYPNAEQEIIGLGGVSTTPPSGEPVLWYEWAGTVTFYPTPASVQTIDVLYTVQPSPVAALTDVLPLDDKYYNDIVNFVLRQAYEMDEDWQASQVKGQQFDASLAAMGEEERTSENMTYSTITVYDLMNDGSY
jgi:hypothetical protein